MQRKEAMNVLGWMKDLDRRFAARKMTTVDDDVSLRNNFSRGMGPTMVVWLVPPPYNNWRGTRSRKLQAMLPRTTHLRDKETYPMVIFINACTPILYFTSLLAHRSVIRIHVHFGEHVLNLFRRILEVVGLILLGKFDSVLEK